MRKRRVVSSPEISGGEPAFCANRIPVGHVSSLLRKGISESEILEDFPHLSAEDLAYAQRLESAGKGNKAADRLTFERMIPENVRVQH
jgi:uncharacterized protein (DUF433 family)